MECEGTYTDVVQRPFRFYTPLTTTIGGTHYTLVSGVPQYTLPLAFEGVAGVVNGTVVNAKVGFIDGELIIMGTGLGFFEMVDNFEMITVIITEIKVKAGDGFVVLWSANNT